MTEAQLIHRGWQLWSISTQNILPMRWDNLIKGTAIYVPATHAHTL